jgi:ribosomal-protein-alanine acetyltransferase
VCSSDLWQKFILRKRLPFCAFCAKIFFVEVIATVAMHQKNSKGPTMTILFLCTGNTCRSPMAAVLFAALCPEYTIFSAGLAAADGLPASVHMQTIARERGFDLSVHKSRQVTPDLLSQADLLVCLSASHARGIAPFAASANIRILGGGITDPYGGSLESYRACAAQIEAALPALAAALRCPARIVPAEEAHIPAIAQLQQAVFYPPASEAVLRQKFGGEHAHFLSALLDGALAGFLGWDEISGETFVDDLAVFPQYQRQGIASALMAQMETAAILRGSEKIHLETRESNAAARALYQARGYRVVGCRKGFYQCPEEDAVLMTLDTKSL